MLSLILVPEAPYCAFYATKHQVYWGVTHNIVFYQYSDLTSHIHRQKQRHASHTGTNRLRQLYKYI